MVAALVGTSCEGSMWFTIGAIVMLVPVVGIAYNSGGLYARRLILPDSPADGGEASEPLQTDEDTHEMNTMIYPSYSLKDCLLFKTIDFWIVACVCAIADSL